MSSSPATSGSASPRPGGGGGGGGAGKATQAALYDQVFGGDGSDISDLSDSDEEQPPARLPFPPRPVPASPVAEHTGAVDEDDVDEDEDEDRDEDDVYVPGTVTSAPKIPKWKKKPPKDDGQDAEGDDQDADEVGRRKKTKKRMEKRTGTRTRAPEPVEEDEEEAPVYDAETQRRMALEEKIDNIGKKAKVTRRKKKGDDDVDIVDSYHDEVCARLRDRMMAAAERDRISNDAKLPATAKLAMLDEVMGVLRNTTLWQSIVDNGVLDAVRQWLEPIAPSGALPAVGIQKAIFEVLPKMDLDTQSLKECRLGPIVLFYTKTKRVTPAVNRQADALVQAWSRPIIKRPANFRSRHVETLSEAFEASRRENEDPDAGAPRGGGALESIGAPKRRKRFDTKSALKENEGRKGARLYYGKDIQYTIAPESQLQHHREDLSHVSRIQMDNRKFNKFARQMKGRSTRG